MEENNENITIIIDDIIQDPLLHLLKKPIEPLLDLLGEPVQEPVPKIIFIVPYRDREQQRIFFMSHMKTILSDIPQSDYKIFFSHYELNEVLFLFIYLLQSW
jgi:hypothetical protein